MLSLIYDYETTGIPSKQIGLDDPSQARAVQLGAVLMLDDKEVGCFYSRFRPNNWPPIHPKAYESHGLTPDDCSECGIDASFAMQLMSHWFSMVDHCVCHNSNFDSQFTDIECCLAGSAALRKQHFCTMLLLTPIVGATKANGQPKWPNLKEALLFCCGEEHVKAHDALADVRATAKLWRYLVNNRLVQI